MKKTESEETDRKSGVGCALSDGRHLLCNLETQCVSIYSTRRWAVSGEQPQVTVFQEEEAVVASIFPSSHTGQPSVNT